MTDSIFPELGLGLIEIGRPWGAQWKGLPPAEQVDELLRTALEENIVFWDTAASYGSSEEHIGRFLRSHPAPRVFLATKFGDHWTAGEAESRMDHSYDALRRSLDRSLEVLPRIDLLQVHRAGAEVLRSRELHRALDYVRAQGIPHLGASVKEVAAAQIAVESGVFTWLQMPYSRAWAEMAPVFEMAAGRGVNVIVNRPFAEGRLLGNSSAEEAFRFILGQRFRGAIIAGTQSPAHLRENARAFRTARDMLTGLR